MLSIEIVNDGSGTAEIGNYRYRVHVNDALIAYGELKGHIRSDGWEALVEAIVQQEKGKKFDEIAERILKERHEVYEELSKL